MLLSLATVALSIVASFASPVIENLTTHSCPDVTVYFARGTFEPLSTGIIAGPEFEAALRSSLGTHTLEFIGVPYLALITTYITGGDPQAAETMADYVTSKAKSCPETKIVISGYSQGAQVTHLAADKLSDDTLPHVLAAVTFGDPYEKDPFPAPINGKVICHKSDLVCGARGGVPIVLPSHFTYGLLDANEAAQFVASLL